MDTMTKVLNLVKPQDWAISLDFADAYMHIPIFPKKNDRSFCFVFKADVFSGKFFVLVQPRHPGASQR